MLKIATPSPDQPIKNLSGGNQQKVVLSKWLFANPEILYGLAKTETEQLEQLDKKVVEEYIYQLEIYTKMYNKDENQKKKDKNEEKLDASLKYNLNIASRGTVDLNNNLIVIKGSVPGKKNTTVFIKDSVKGKK